LKKLLIKKITLPHDKTKKIRPTSLVFVYRIRFVCDLLIQKLNPRTSITNKTT